jgi:hypothetical protein
MRVIIAGSRSITSYVAVLDAIAASGWRDEITEVVSGRARGVDLLGEHWANRRHIPVKPFPVTDEDYQTYGRYQAPKVRNARMAEYADALILVWDGVSGGSADMLRRAKAHGLRIHEHIVQSTPTGEQEVSG